MRFMEAHFDRKQMRRSVMDGQTPADHGNTSADERPELEVSLTMNDER
jgi:hypothetical protein